MPVALRTRSWEDHVTPHSRKQYSYDDLDLVCCHAGVGGTGSPAGRRQRERCASMPECCRHHPGFDSCPGEDRNQRRTLSGTFKGITASYEGNSQIVTKGHTFVKVRKSKADEDNIHLKDCPSSPNCSAPISNHFLYKSFDETDEKITSKSMATSSGNSSTNSAEEQAKNLDCSTTEAETKYASKDNAKVNIDVATELTGKPATSSEPTVEGNSGDLVVEASLLHHQQVMRLGVEATVNDTFDPEVSLVPHDAITNTALTTEIKQSEESQILKNNVVLLNSNIPNDQVVTSEDVLQAHNLKEHTELEFSSCESRSTSNPDTYRDCHTKLDTIPELSFTELGEEVLTPMMEDMPGPHVTTTLMGLKGAGNNKGSSVEMEIQKEAGILGNFQRNMALTSPKSETSIKSRMETSHHVMILQMNPNMDEDDPKPQEVPVRLRTQKSSRQDKDRERSQLDSMVLLIMKLDQLDQEIQDALGSTPFDNDTPTAKKSFVSEVDLVSLDGEGSLSASLRSLNAPHHQSSSSLCSVRNKTLAALSEKDQAGPV
ncbi:hypothetical protein Q7C36_001584 [Tachysurus vachellii]|uniref:Uncharacterized protein n=1 Tax=Tachysurus vachellii TaxID=175792 RepID=A0AA88NUC8_TACVA|nr:hypothetical protein Q7C36_001584 [Tachysurus vachellii]